MKIFSAIIYLVGVLSVIILSACVIVQSNYIPFPDAMLPMKLCDLAEIWLTIGFLPMTLATILFRRRHENFSRIIFLPSIICAGFGILILYEVLDVING